MNYKNSNLIIQSDFEIRELKHPANDIDLIIPIDNRVLNLIIPKLPPFMKGRLQFTQVSAIMVRFNTDESYNQATIHLMRNIDMATSLVNFIIDYKGLSLNIRDREGYIELKLMEI